MDLHSLSRRDLQALCKRNKIPANITNLAMADALKALQLVEGIEDFLEPSQSETAESSIESPVRSEATSPYVPPTGGRTTRRRNVGKEEPETVNPMTRSRRTIRKTVAKDADVIQTPAAVGQTELKECLEEEKKDALMTPAQLGVTSRRRRGLKEESAVTRVYSTRRSTRLAEKTGAKNGQSGLFKNDLHTEDGESMMMNLKDSLDNLDIISEADASTTVEKNSDKKDEMEFVSAQERDISIGDEKEVVCTIEDTDKDAGHADEVSDDLDNIVIESEDNNAVEEFIHDTDICNEIEKEMHDDNDMDSEHVSDFNVNEEVQEMNTAVNVDVVEEVSNLDDDEESTDVVVEENGKSLQVNKEKHEEVEIVFQPTRLTPIKNSATTFIVSDNKENIGSILTKESVKIVKNTVEHASSKLDDLSVRKLTKMLKEKLQITNKSSDDEIISHEPAQVVARPALQAIPENI